MRYAGFFPAWTMVLAFPSVIQAVSGKADIYDKEPASYVVGAVLSLVLVLFAVRYASAQMTPLFRDQKSPDFARSAAVFALGFAASGIIGMAIAVSLTGR